MIKNVAMTTPTIGRIAIGEMQEIDGRRLPKRLNHFLITTQFKRHGSWTLHPMHEAVIKAQNPEASKEELDSKKITEIPVKLMFNKPELNLSSRLEAYDKDGRLVCAGDGMNAKRVVDNVIESVPCSGCDTCPFGRENRCDKMVRLLVIPNVNCPGVIIDGMSGFILRSRGHNTYKALTAKLERLYELLDGNLIGVPMVLRLVGKTSRESHQSAFFYVTLDLEQDWVASISAGKEEKKRLEDAGINFEKYEAKAVSQLEQGLFHDTACDVDELEDLITARDINSADDGGGPQEAANDSPGVENDEVLATTGLAALKVLCEATAA